MKTRIPKRVYTTQFREAAVRQVMETGTLSGRSPSVGGLSLAGWLRTPMGGAGGER